MRGWCTCLCKCVWRPEVNARRLPWSSPTFYVEEEFFSHLDLEFTYSASLASHLALEILRFCLLGAGITGSHHTWLMFTQTLGI